MLLHACLIIILTGTCSVGVLLIRTIRSCGRLRRICARVLRTVGLTLLRILRIACLIWRLQISRTGRRRVSVLRSSRNSSVCIRRLWVTVWLSRLLSSARGIHPRRSFFFPRFRIPGCFSLNLIGKILFSLFFHCKLPLQMKLYYALRNIIKSVRDVMSDDIFKQTDSLASIRLTFWQPADRFLTVLNQIG